jgi:predicted alpha/beta superfamily hydrolase
MNMKNILVLSLLFSLSYIAAAGSEKKSFKLPKIKVISIQDSKSQKQYELYIKLPEGYSKAENKGKEYPVIYIADAVWHIELLSATTEFLIEDAILVGISWQKDINEDLMEEYGEHASRFSDYSFWKKTNPKHPKLQFGQASNHLAFIRNDVFNYIEQNYRTNPNNRSYFGYSMSGLFGAYIIMAQPDTFKNYILGSPSVQLLFEGETKIEFKNKKLNANVFISHGTLEKKLREPISKFVTLMKARNDNNFSIKHVVIKGSHQTAFPMTGVRSVTWLSNLQKEEDK